MYDEMILLANYCANVSEIDNALRQKHHPQAAQRRRSLVTTWRGKIG
jgi:hypothetical protein